MVIGSVAMLVNTGYQAKCSERLLFLDALAAMRSGDRFLGKSFRGKDRERGWWRYKRFERFASGVLQSLCSLKQEIVNDHERRSRNDQRDFHFLKKGS